MATESRFHVQSQYLIFDSLLIFYNLYEVSQSVAGGRVKAEIKFPVFFALHHCCGKEKSLGIKAKR